VIAALIVIHAVFVLSEANPATGLVAFSWVVAGSLRSRPVVGPAPSSKANA